MIAVAIVNYRTATTTMTCVEAVLASTREVDSLQIFLLDNGSGSADVERLQLFASRIGDTVQLIQSSSNLGFAGGTNLLLELILDREVFDVVLLLNSDTLPTPGFIDAMRCQLDPANNIDMVAARMLRPGGQAVDSLGIALYRSTLASNRKSESEKLLGPTGGCALLTRRLLVDLRASHGEWFDESFFCYAEDTDLVLRARWLGYQPAYAAAAIVYHEGSLSSGGSESNDFVLYFGIRNSIWWLAKDAPAIWLLLSVPWFIALHSAICIRHLRRGRGKVLWRLYRDAFGGLTRMLRKRARIFRTRRVDNREFHTWIEPHFYERGYLRRAWRELWNAGAPAD